MQRPSQPWKPTPDQLAAARGKTVPDVIAGGLSAVFVGINPGLYSGAVGHHFARPGNRFWKALQEARFTEDVLSPFEDFALLERGIGITNIVARSTASAAELSSEELARGATALRRKLRRLEPTVVAFLGIGAYRIAFARPRTKIGKQAERLAGSRVWVLPNPSGLNANYQLPDLARWFRALRQDVSRHDGR